MTASSDDIAVDDMSDSAHGVFLRTVELECLAGGRVIVGDFLEGFADVDYLWRLVCGVVWGLVVLRVRGRTFAPCCWR